MPLPSFSEIKERKVVQWGLAYLGAAWLVLQVAALLSAAYGWPGFVMRALPVVLGLGFFAALVVAWYHGEKGAQRVSGPELAILGGLLLLGGLGVMLIGGGADAAPEAEEPTSAVAGLIDPEVEETAIAVLPFKTIGGGETYFADGLTDELHQTLSRVPTLRVTAQTSAGIFRQASVSADSIGRALNVAHLVEGTVREIGEGRVRIAARLVDAETGQQTWSETYDRDVADVFAVHEEIARAVAFQLRVEVGSAAMVGRPPADPEVFALVVRARQLVERGGDSPTAWQESKRLLEEAVALDSTYAPAWAHLAWARYGLATRTSIPESREEATEARQEALADAERALALDPDEGVAHDLLAVNMAEHGEGSLETIKGHMERAVAARPADASQLGNLAYTLMILGDERGALRLAERATVIDPLAPDAWRMASVLHSITGQHERAIELGRTMLRLVPDQPVWGANLALVLAAAGETEEAIELAQRAVDADPRSVRSRSSLAFAHAKAGHRAEAERLLDDLSEEVGEPLYQDRAIVETALEDADAAFEALERSVAMKEKSVIEIPTHPFFLPLHDDPRWDPLVARIRAEAAR